MAPVDAAVEAAAAARTVRSQLAFASVSPASVPSSLASLRLLSYTHRLCVAALLCLAVALATRTAHRHLAPGLPRLAIALPCVAALLHVHQLFDATGSAELLTVLVTLACVAWWASTRVLLVAVGRSTVSRRKHLFAYAAELLLPLSTASTVLAGRSVSQLLARVVGKSLLLAAACFALQSPLPVFHLPMARHALYVLGMYSFLGALGDGPGVVITALCGVSLSPHFNNPFTSSSCADFWGRRWNVTAAHLLRRSVYEPIMQGQLVGHDADVDVNAAADSGKKRRASGVRRVTWKPSLLRQSAAVCATFVASGIAHELILHQVIDAPWTCEWLMFFSLQGPLLCVEAVLKPHLPRTRLLLTPACLLLLLRIGGALFFPVAMRSGLDVRVVTALTQRAQEGLSVVRGVGEALRARV